MPHNGYLVRLLACSEIAHLCLFRVNRSAAGMSSGCSASPITVLGARAFLHSDSRASRHDRWAQLLLCVCDAGFQGTSNCVLGTSPLSLLRRTPKPGSAETSSSYESTTLLKTLLAHRQVVAQQVRGEGCVRGSVAPLPCGGLAWRLWFGLPTASGPKSAWVCCGCRPGPTRDAPIQAG